MNGGDIQLKNDKLGLISGIVTIVSAGLMLNGHAEGIAQDIGEFSSNLYNKLDELNINLKAVNGKGLYETVEERENIINTIAEIAKVENLNPEFLLGNLELLVNTGNFKDESDDKKFDVAKAMEFDATLREMLYNQGKSAEEINIAVESILYAMNENGSADFKQLVLSNLGEDVYNAIGGDNATEDTLLDYMAKEKDNIAKIFDSWIVPPSEQEVIDAMQINFDNRAISLEYSGVLTPENFKKWYSLDSSKTYSNYRYKEIENVPSLSANLVQYGSRGEIKDETYMYDEPEYKIELLYLMRQEQDRIANMNKYDSSTSEATDDSKVIPNTTVLDIGYRQAVNGGGINNTSQLDEDSQNLTSSYPKTLNSQGLLTDPTYSSELDENGEEITLLQNLFNRTKQGLLDIELYASSFSGTEIINSVSNSVVSTYNSDLLEEAFSLMPKILGIPKEVVVNNTIERYADVDEVIAKVTSSLSVASRIVAGVTPKNKM